ncbi:MAG: carbohydrate-binding family 9-like protein [Verrucomicrobiota bacterium]|nr:carbohydrate-binding family 9-like protein [Verrucomicrobiota bacterium]
MEMVIPKVRDFEVTGDGSANAWKKASWHSLVRVAGTHPYETKAKVLYSTTGIYFLFDCPDKQLTCTMKNDFDNIFTEDVVEVFLWPDEKKPLYLEYELSPLNVELNILVPNHNSAFFGWRPWHYNGTRVPRRATSVRGGRKASKAKVEAWMAEFFLPFSLFSGVCDTPKKGTQWRANWYRIDYDFNHSTQWAWCPKTKSNFHDYKNFGSITFG